MNVRVIAIAILLLSGCAGKAIPERELYLLRADAPNQFSEARTHANIGLGAVRVASYIDQPGLVMETATGSMNAARYNEWAEPLRESLRTLLANEIAAAAGQPVRPRSYGETNWKRHTRRLIDISIEQLHGTADGDALLVAYWAVIDPEERTILSEHQFSDRQPLTVSGYPALVEAQKRLLSDLASEIAGSLDL
jgi:uncharacterized lipoprotein YmbA